MSCATRPLLLRVCLTSCVEGPLSYPSNTTETLKCSRLTIDDVFIGDVRLSHILLSDDMVQKRTPINSIAHCSSTFY